MLLNGGIAYSEFLESAATSRRLTEIQGLPAGIYMMQIQVDGGLITKRIIKK